jgi:hypothetical protein
MMRTRLYSPGNVDYSLSTVVRLTQLFGRGQLSLSRPRYLLDMFNHVQYMIPHSLIFRSHQLADVVRVILGVLDKLFDRHFYIIEFKEIFLALSKLSTLEILDC